MASDLNYGMPYFGGAVLLSVVMDRLGFSELIVSDSDNLEGYAKKRGLL